MLFSETISGKIFSHVTGSDDEYIESAARVGGPADQAGDVELRFEHYLNDGAVSWRTHPAHRGHLRRHPEQQVRPGRLLREHAADTASCPQVRWH